MADSMIERVAKAIEDNVGNTYAEVAIAAIEAMRDYTPGMIDSAVESAVPVSYSEAGWCWTAMIDAALSSKDKGE